MSLETGTYISDLNASNPDGATSPVSEVDGHLKLLKSTIKATFPNVAGAVTPTHTELNFVDGVTSAIQTQLDAKAALNSPALTGTPTAPTATAGTNTTQIATTAFVNSAIGGSAAAGAWVLLKSTTASSSATVDFVNGSGGVVISSTYDEYMVVLIGVKPSTDADALWARTSTNAGSSYDSSAGTYFYNVLEHTTVGTDSTNSSTSETKLVLATSVGNASNEDGVFMTVQFYAPSAAARLRLRWSGVYTNSSAAEIATDGYGIRLAAADVDAIRFMFSTGNIASGTINLYGRRK